LDSLPAAVQAALKTKAAGAKITKVESLTKSDKLVAYEAATLKAAKQGEIQIGPTARRFPTKSKPTSRQKKRQD
jgi:hypothetical protein